MSIEATPKTVTVSIPLTSVIHAGLVQVALREKRELTEHIQRVLGEHVIDQKAIEHAEAARLQLFWSLVDRAVEVAKARCRADLFTPAITSETIRECVADESWAADYRKYVQDDIYKQGNPLKGPINRELGFRIKNGIGGVVRTVNGKPENVKAKGEIIQSYTPLVSFDPSAVQE